MENKEILKRILKKNEIKKVEMDDEASGHVDDTYNFIATKDHENLEEYLNNFFNVWKEYHLANKLKLNAEKTKLLTTSQTKHKHNNKDTELVNPPGEKYVKPDNQIKVL